LQIGNYNLELSQTGLNSFSKNIEITENQKLDITHHFEKGLRIESNPANAEVWIDLKSSGNTPANLSLPTGEHQLALKKKGFEDFKANITVAANTENLSYNLKSIIVENNKIKPVISGINYKSRRNLWFGVSGASLAAAGVCAGLASSKYSSYTSATDDAGNSYSGVTQFKMLTYICAGIGAVALIPAISATIKHKKSQSKVTLNFVPTGNGGFVALRMNINE
jgi:hypothetical protein